MGEEDWYYYPWNDPKNEGKKFTREEIEKEFPNGKGWGTNDSIDGEIEKLKSEGRYEYSDREYLDMIDEKMNNSLNKVLPDTEPPTEKPYKISNYNPNREESVEPVIEEDIFTVLSKADSKDLDEIIENDLMPKLVEKVEDLRSCFDEFEALRKDQADKLDGYYASVNQQIFKAVSDDVNKVYRYMLESTIPAIDKVIELKETAEECSKKEEELEKALEKLNKLEGHPPSDSYEYMTTTSEYFYNWETLEYERYPNGGIIKVETKKYREWLDDLEKTREIVFNLRKEIKELVIKEKELIDEIKDFEELRLVFTDIVE